MKQIIMYIFLLSVAFWAQAQQELVVETFHLKNGLKVILCEEHSQPKIYGCVVVHAGSKNEKATATGVAHYFEHIMFKGTDRIGTTNWPKEKLYLDSISKAYDRLQAATDNAERHDIQLEINRLNIAASQYAIPNEVDAILQKMGCTGLNAGTSYDYTVYYNTLPSNQLSNWMEVYAERFRNPVFRLFQSELEAIYEEKNMYDNQMMHDFSRNLLVESFGEHPYSREVIGLAEHLKNPQPSEMQKFFDTYYVANNMTLLLVGDFNTAEARKLVEDKFCAWRSAELPEQPKYNLPDFATQKVVNVRQTPIKAGLMIFPGVKQGDADYMPLEMLGEILGGGSGLLDKATSDGKLMMAQLMPLSLRDAGSNVVIYIPNIVGQSHAKAEEVVWACIDSIKQGHFSNELMESVKMKHVVMAQRQVENYSSIASLLLGLEMEGSDYTQWVNDNRRWMQLTKEEVMEVANKYFQRDHCTLVRSNMGFPKHDAAVKPDWDHLEAQNKDAHSPFAKMIEENRPEPIQPKAVDFKKDVAITKVAAHCPMYSVANPKNDVFELKITYNYGLIDDYNLDRAAGYIVQLGAPGMDLQQYNMALDQMGATVRIYTQGNDQFVVYIEGLEQNLDSILSLTTSWLFSPNHDKRQIDKMVDELKANVKSNKNSSADWRIALRDYVGYGQLSPNLRQMPIKEWGKLSGEQLHDEVMKVFSRNGYVTYSGNTEPSAIAEKLLRSGLVREEVQTVDRRDFKRNQPTETQVVYAHNKKFLQSDIEFMMPSGNFDTADIAARLLFNEYFGGGMNSIVFQEIREFRSLGYSTYGFFNYDTKRINPAYFMCYLGTQCDKTLDGVEAMRGLMLTLPERHDKLQPAKEHLIVARNSSHSDFRGIPGYVASCIEQGYDHDPSIEITERISHLNMDNLKAFHAKYIGGRPLVVLITGNAKKYDPKSVARLFGTDVKAQEVKYKQMFKTK